MTLLQPKKQLARNYGSARLGIVQTVRLQSDGTPVCDVLDTYGGVWLNCRMLAPGGGGADQISYSPPQPADNPEDIDPQITKGAEVLLLFAEGTLAHPFVLATTLHPSTYGVFDDDIDVLPDGDDWADKEDYPSGDQAAKAGVHDHVIEIKGVRLLVSEHGVVIDTKRAAKPVRIQLPHGQVLRVSLDEEANERVLLGEATKTLLAAMTARINYLTTAIAQLETFQAGAALIDPATSAAYVGGIPVVDPVTGNPTGTFATVKPYQWFDPATGEILIGGTAAVISADPLPAPGDDILASIMRISDHSKAGEAFD